MMKKISLKGIKLSGQRRQADSSPRIEPRGSSRVEDEIIIHDGQNQNDSRSHSLAISTTHSHYADDNTAIVDDVNHKRKEKFGILRNLRRRFTPNVNRKTDNEGETTQHIEVSTPSPLPMNVLPTATTKSARHTHIRGDAKKSKQKDRGRCRLPVCDKSTKSNSSSQSCDSLDLNIHPQTPTKMSEIHCNTDRNDDRRVKASCRTKDISTFQADDRTKRDSGVGETPESDETEDGDEQPHPSNREVLPTCSNNRHSSQSMSLYQRDPNRHRLDVYSSPFERLELPDLYSTTQSLNHVKDVKVWSLTQELFRLSKFGWYWGPITRLEAEDKLINQPDGAFLVRDSSDERYLLSLSFRSFGRTLHTRIEHCNGMFSFYAMYACEPDTEGYPSIVDLIEHSMNDLQTGIFCYSRSRSPGAPSFPVRLTKPMSRFTQVRSLQYLCRFVIRQYTRYDHIQELPLPNRIKGWIEENQY